MKKVIFVLLLLPFFFFASPVLAEHPADLRGKVFMMIEGEEIPLKDVMIFRKKSPWDKNIEWGVPNRTNASGKYSYADGSLMGFSYCSNSHDHHCPSIYIGKSSLQSSSCDGNRRESCGLVCTPASPYRFLAYFPKDYNQNNLPAGVYFKEGDMKGGGSWQVGGSVSNANLKVKPGNNVWSVNAANFGVVSYQPYEWFRAEVVNNADGLNNINIEWIPPIDYGDYSCTSLTFSAQGEVGVGNKLTFTCSSSIGDKLSFAGYNYRVKRPGDPVGQWHVPDNFSDRSGESGEFEITEVGSYQVQCQTCIHFQSGQACTDWGKAN